MVKIDLNCDNFIKDGDRLEYIQINLGNPNKLDKKIRFNTANYYFDHLNLFYVNEIHLDSNPFSLKKSTTTFLALWYSRLNLFMNGRRIAKKSDCNRKVFKRKPSSIFRGFTKLQLTRMIYTTKICPIIFHKVKFDAFSIINQENLDDIQFMNINDDYKVDANIKLLNFEGIRSLSIRKSFFSIHIFRETEEIRIYESNVVSIESDAIQHLPKLVRMAFSNLTFKQFYAKHKRFFMNPKNRKDLKLNAFNQTFIGKNMFKFTFWNKSFPYKTATDFCAYKYYPLN